MTRCHEIRAYLEAFVDDELSTDNYLRVQEHLGGCAVCAEEVLLTRALKRSVRDVVVAEARPAPQFMHRLSDVIADERRCQERHMAEVMPWRRRAVPVAMAAIALLAVGAGHGVESSWVKSLGSTLFGAPLTAQASEGGGSATGSEPFQNASVVVNPQDIIDQLVHYHQAPVEPEVTDRSALLRLEPQVGVPMRAPELQEFGWRFLGASVVPMERHRAASLRYNLGEHRVTVYVFNPQVVPVRALRELQVRVIGDRAVFVGMRNGYSIGAVEQRGVGYMIATDLDDRESAELLASIR